MNKLLNELKLKQLLEHVKVAKPGKAFLVPEQFLQDVIDEIHKTGRRVNVVQTNKHTRFGRNVKVAVQK